VITEVMIGRVIDLGICDANNMGAAMAPAAADTLLRFFAVSGEKPEDFDRIVTGDLGRIGSRLLHTLLEEQGISIRRQHMDCGCEMYRGLPDVDAGASGCGCGASVLCGLLLPQMQEKVLTRILFMATGALLSTTTSQQGKSIPGVAHAVVIERRDTAWSS